MTTSPARAAPEPDPSATRPGTDDRAVRGRRTRHLQPVPPAPEPSQPGTDENRGPAPRDRGVLPPAVVPALAAYRSVGGLHGVRVAMGIDPAAPIPEGAHAMTVQPPISARAAEQAFWYEIEPTAELQASWLRVEAVGGSVPPAALAHAWEQMRHVSRYSHRSAWSGRTRLWAEGHGISNATADAIFIFDGEVLICAGATAPTMRDAIDQLAARLRQRIIAGTVRDANDASGHDALGGDVDETSQMAFRHDDPRRALE
jgi:hypothetical protein